MECKDIAAHIEPYLDGELTLSDRREVEKHLPQCSNCSAQLESLQVLHGAISNMTYDNVPASLKKNIHAGLKDITGEDDNYNHTLFGWLGFSGGAMALVSVIVWAMVSVNFTVPMQARVSEEIITAHVRSLLVDHATDIVSTDSHTVKPWFNGKLDFSPAVKNYAQQGFILLGGRLDYINKKTSSALVYKKRAHIINVFITRAEADNQSMNISTSHQQGYNLLHWSNSGLEYWVISDLNKSELGELAQLLRQG